MIVSNVNFTNENLIKYEKQLGMPIFNTQDILVMNMKKVTIFLSSPKVSIETLELFPNLELVLCTSSGVDGMPLEYLKNRGIALVNSKGIHVEFMSEYAIGAMLMVARGFIYSIQQQVNNVWNQQVTALSMLNNCTVAIIGTGMIGTSIAEKCKFFGMKTIGVNRGGKNVPHFDQIYMNTDLNQAVESADYVIVVVPLTNNTQKMITKEIFSAMKKEAVFINISRGLVIDESDLVYALDNSYLKLAILDVFQEEPLPSSSPLWNNPKIIITPHISGDIANYMDFVMTKFSDIINDCQDEATISAIDYELGY